MASALSEAAAASVELSLLPVNLRHAQVGLRVGGIVRDQVLVNLKRLVILLRIDQILSQGLLDFGRIGGIQRQSFLQRFGRQPESFICS